METQVKAHYNSSNLKEKIFQAIEERYPHAEQLSLKDLAPIDQLHTGGAKATLDLFEKVSLEPGAKVLDAGCGIGGSSRLMAQKLGFTVTGIDLSDQFIETAKAISDRYFNLEPVSFHQGSIIDMPFENDFFDAVFCQHVIMNIKDKEKAFKEFNRVLKKKGKLILHEIVKGEKEPIMYPVPWASEAGISFLENWDRIEPEINASGFNTLLVNDWTRAAAGCWAKAKEIAQKNKSTPPVLGSHLIFGENARQFLNTMNFNLKSNCINAVEAVFIKG